MSDREKWDRQHVGRTGSYTPAKFLQDTIQSGAWPIPRGRALDIATGKGRNALFLAEQGFDVVGIHISPVGLAEARAQAAARSLTRSMAAGSNRQQGSVFRSATTNYYKHAT